MKKDQIKPSKKKVDNPLPHGEAQTDDFQLQNINDELMSIYNSFDVQNAEGLTGGQFVDRLQKAGIRKNDVRLKPVFQMLQQIPANGNKQHLIPYHDFRKVVGSANIVRQALLGDLAIPEFDDFCQEVTALYHEVKNNRNGKVASYIPQLAEVNPDMFAISICTISGQRFSIGDFGVDFTLQSVSKPLTYCMVLEELGESVVHQHVDKEPSGLAFNELKLKLRNGANTEGHGEVKKSKLANSRAAQPTY